LNYLLDTNACIAVLKGTPAAVRLRFDAELARQTNIFISAVVAFELWYGVFKSQRPSSNSKGIQQFFTATMGVLAFDENDAISAGRIRAELASVGTPIGTYDVLIAAQALRRELTVVTANVSEFRRVKGLKWEDWSATGRHH
jgi:tRNA(fMet)-specific endonuclease VapC